MENQLFGSDMFMLKRKACSACRMLKDPESAVAL